MTKQWNARLKSTLTIYFNSGTKAEKPMPENVLVIRQKTPIGANFMTIFVISIIISLNWAKKFETISTFSPSFARMIPMTMANKIICSILPSAIP